MVRALFPGTFDPIHNGHIDIALRGSRVFDEVVVAVYDKPLKTLLFSPEERLEMTRVAFAGRAGVKVVGYSGLTVEFCRQVQAKVILRGLRVFSDFEHEFRMALSNHRLAPDIEVMALITSEEHSFLSGTTVREIAALGGEVSTLVPPHVAAALRRRFGELGEEGARMVPLTELRD